MDKSEWLLQEIREISHGFGERRPRIDSITEIRSVLVRQMTLLIYKTKQEAGKHGDKQILIKHIVSVIKNCKFTLIRVLSYYLLKDNIYRLSTNGIKDTDDTLKEDNSIKQVTKEDFSSFEDLINPDFDKTLDLNINNIDSLSLLSYDFTTPPKYTAAQLKKSIFKQFICAIAELKLEFKITKEDIKNATEKRQIRVNDLSLALGAERYEGFQVCRKKHFRNDKGDLLLRHVHKYLPPKINYDKQVKEVFLFLAKETIAAIIDHVYENRSQHVTNDESKQLEDEDIPKLKKKKIENKFESILVEEIKNVTNTYWKDNEFFENQLVFL